MHIATAWSTDENPALAFDGAYARLHDKLGCAPSLLLVLFTEAYPAAVMLAAVRALPPDIRVHGLSICTGVMTEEGFHGQDGRAIGLWGLHDPDGSFGVGMALLNGDPGQAVTQALDQALAEAGRPGEVPDLVWVSTSPGSEEAVLRGIKGVLGSTAQVFGGSAADNGVAGRWSLLSRDAAANAAVVISVMFPTMTSSASFQSGYSPTERHGRITAASGRVLQRIDDRLAADVYNEWTGGLIESALDGGNILPVTSLSPLGRVAGKVGEMAFYMLSHPDAVVEGGALSLFTEVEAGQEVVLMTGSPHSLVTRAARVTEAAMALDNIQRSRISGALVVYCAGCMLTVRNQMPAVVDGLNASLGGKPFLGAFTFGEQGCVVGRESVHGNLMISSIVFSH
jgi:hypothetical protein